MTCDRCGQPMTEYHYAETWPGDDAGKPYTPSVQRRLHEVRDCATNGATRQPTSVVDSHMTDREPGPMAHRATERTETGGA